MPATHKQSKGFTLIELSIVLVIIGLIVGGVLVGQDLIRAAEMRSIQDDWSKFEAARQTFRLKYNCLPGDCPNAATFGLGTNGNGNKVIDHPGSSGETWQYWSQLASAGLIEGNYTGVQGGGGANHADIGTNAPASKISGVGYSLYQRTPNSYTWHNDYGLPGAVTTHMLLTGKERSTSLSSAGAFFASEAYALNQKFDDGLANDGKIRSMVGIVAQNIIGCTSGVAPNYSYDLTTNGLCNLFYTFNH